LSRNLESAPAFRKAIALNEQLKGSNSEAVAYDLNGYGAVCVDLRRFRSADESLLRAWDILYKKNLRNSLLAAVLGNVARMRREQGFLDESDRLRDMSLAIYIERSGPLNDETTRSRLNFASLRMAQGRYAEGEELARVALEYSKQVHGDQHPIV